MLTYYGIPIALKVINQRFGTGLLISMQSQPQSLLLLLLPLMRQLMLAKQSEQQSSLLVKEKLKQLEVWE